MPIRAYMTIAGTTDAVTWTPSVDEVDKASFSAPSPPGMEILAFDVQIRRDKTAIDPDVTKKEQTEELNERIKWLIAIHTSPQFPPFLKSPIAPPATTSVFLDALAVIRPVDENSAFFYKLAFQKERTLKVTISVSAEPNQKTAANSSVWQLEFSEAVISAIELLGESSLIPFGKGPPAAPSAWDKGPWIGPVERIHFDYKKIKWAYGGNGTNPSLMDLIP